MMLHNPTYISAKQTIWWQNFLESSIVQRKYCPSKIQTEKKIKGNI